MKNPKAKILVVDDEVEACRAIGLALGAKKYENLSAHNGVDAIEIIKTEKPDVVLLDIRMPGIDGIETLQRIRKFDKDCIVIMLTGVDNPDTIITAIREGADDFIRKPVMSPTLLHSIDIAMDKRHLTLENRKYQDKLEELVLQQTKDIRDSEAMLKAVTSSVNDAIIMMDGRGMVIFWNPAAELMFQYTVGEILGRRLADFILPDKYRESHTISVEAFSHTGKGNVINNTVELSAVRKDKTEFPIELSLSAIKIAGQWNAVGIIRDITERKTAEKKLRDNEERLSRIVETIAEGIYIVDRSGQIIFANKEAESIFGMSRDQLRERTYNDNRWSVRKLDGEPFGEDDYPFKRVQKEKGPVRGIEFITTDPAGGEMIVSVNAAPLYDSSGAFQGMVATQANITERKRAEKQLGQAHMENEQLLSALPLALVSMNKDLLILKWNNAAENILGIKPEDAVGRNFRDLAVDWDLDKLGGLINSGGKTGGGSVAEEISFTKPDGKPGFLKVTINTLPHGPDGSAGFLLVGDDITERRILGSRLTQAQKLESIGSLAAGIAHEINTPTQFVGDNTHFLKGAFEDIKTLLDKYAQMLAACKRNKITGDIVEQVESAVEEADVDFLSEEIPKAIEASLRGVARVSTIVKAMKDFSHPGSKEKSLVDINTMIDSTITISRNEWKYVAELTTDFDPKLGLAPCYPDEFNQVILNLITNASHAIGEKLGEGSEEKGVIMIRTKREEGFAVITVEDSGGGIDDSIKEKVFDHFFTTKQVGRGTGQGLSISRSIIVEKHGGEMFFTSESGKGTIFTIRLPLDEQAGG